jgi:sRNA-binding regulator protein Hfq
MGDKNLTAVKDRVQPRPSPAGPREPAGLLHRLLGRLVAVRLIGGEELTGLLADVGRYEVLIRVAGDAETVVLKGAILTVRAAGTGRA